MNFLVRIEQEKFKYQVQGHMTYDENMVLERVPVQISDKTTNRHWIIEAEDWLEAMIIVTVATGHEFKDMMVVSQYSNGQPYSYTDWWQKDEYNVFAYRFTLHMWECPPSVDTYPVRDVWHGPDLAKCGID